VLNPPDKVFVLMPENQVEEVRLALARRFN
jgi:hypothetical protein